MSINQPLPVSGFTIDERDVLAALEEEILRVLDRLAQMESVDKRWLAIGRTHLEEAFMAINRSIFQPQRVK